MKGLKAIGGVLLLCLTLGCKKDKIENFSNEDAISSISSSQISSTKGINQSDWMSALKWEVANQPSHSVYYTTINLNNINTSGSTLLVYKQDNTGATAILPFEENKGSQKIYWYYEMNDGSIMISADVYGQVVNPVAASSFKYIVLSNSAVSDFEKRGVDKTKIMVMPYEKFSELNH
jgi:hypothetical protein